MIKVAIKEDYLLKDYTEESFPNADIIRYGYQEIILDDKYHNCKHEDFDFINGRYQFNAVKYSTRHTLEITAAYHHRVSSLIHEKYSIDDELALINNKDTRPAEYQSYQQYRDKCKAQAKQEEGI